MRSIHLICALLLLGSVGFGQFAIRINAGGPTYTDTSSNVWSADELSSGGQTDSTAAAIANTSDPTLYQTERYGAFGYSVGVPVATYTVTLKFAETFWTNPGVRVFNVSINNVQVLTNFDPFAQSGGENIAIDKTFTGITAPNGVINIRFIAVDGDPSIKAFSIVQTGSYTPPSPPSGTGVLAQSANVFLNSLGVNTHIGQGYSEANYEAPIEYMGLRTFRDGANGSLADIGTLSAHTGAKADLIIGCDEAQQDANNVLPYVYTYVASPGYLLAMEGPNEPNNFPITFNGATGGGTGNWTPVSLCQTAIYGQIKGGPLAAYPVWQVTQAGGEMQNVGLQFLNIPTGSGLTMPDSTVYADAANMHNYVSSNNGSLDEDNQAWLAEDTQNNAWPGDKLYTEYGLTYAQGYTGYNSSQLLALPRVTTETGWDTVGNPGGQSAQAQKLTSQYLDAFKRGWAYTYIYELIDGEGGDSTQGLYTSAVAPKTAATWIHNMTTILSDAATISSPGFVNYSISSEPTTVHDLLLQKNSGVYELVVWDERASSSSTTDTITVNLGSTVSSVNVYDISSGTTPTSTLTSVSSVSLTLSNHAMILELPSTAGSGGSMAGSSLGNISLGGNAIWH